MTLTRRALAAAAFVAGTSLAPSARAADKAACLAASENAQKLRNEGKLTEARAELAICGRPECPKLVQQDCAQWMGEVMSALPTLVLGAKDRDGNDLVDVKASIDGREVAGRLDGRAIPIDPGVHTVTFEAKGAPAVEEKVVARQGEKDRLVTVTIALGGPPPVEPGPSAPKDQGERASSPPIAAYVVGGLGVAALGAALVLDLAATSDAHDLRDTCAPRCEQSQVDDIQKRYTIAGITAGVGAAALVTGVVLFVLHGRAHASASPRSGALSAPLLSVAPTPGGAAATAVVRF